MRHFPPRPAGRHTGWSPTRDRNAQKRFRAFLVERSGGRCEFPGCETPFDRLQAHHDRPGYGPSSGRLLCRAHHMLEDPYAR